VKVTSYEAPHYAVFRYHKKQIFSILLQCPLVSQEGHCAVNLMHSNGFKSYKEESCTKYRLLVRHNEKQPQQGEHTLFLIWCCAAMIDKHTIVLQSCTNSEKVLVGPYGEAYPACHDGNQTMNIKSEEVSDAEVEEDPLPITFQETKAEPEVSLMSLYVHSLADITNMQK
jgi:hypothetical protein